MTDALRLATPSTSARRVIGSLLPITSSATHLLGRDFVTHYRLSNRRYGQFDIDDQLRQPQPFVRPPISHPTRI